MAGSLNKIMLIGNLGRDPEMRYTPSGDPVADFSVATSERRRGSDGQPHEQTTWFRVSAWGKLAEVASAYLHKGSLVYVEGPLAQREWTGNDGAPHTTLEVRAREVRMLDRRGDEQVAVVATPTEDAAPALDDVPF